MTKQFQDHEIKEAVTLDYLSYDENFINAHVSRLPATFAVACTLMEETARARA
jgi:hypothetical protein